MQVCSFVCEIFPPGIPEQNIGDQRMCKVRLLCKNSFFILSKIMKYWYISNQLLVQIVLEFINNLNVIYFIIELTGSDVLYCTTGISRKVLLREFYLPVNT